jgi:hypothetical protein
VYEVECEQDYEVEVECADEDDAVQHAFGDSFTEFYNAQGRAAGTYTQHNYVWSREE